MSAGKRRTILALAAVLAALAIPFAALRGCTLMPWAREEGTNVRVLVSITRDFGSVLIRQESVRVPASGVSAMEALKKTADVETDYGGRFVSAIDGLLSSHGSGGGKDWFYYVNGVLAGAGALDFAVKDGDHIWWDYHRWGEDDFVPAVVGSYPRPFTDGYSRKKAVSTIAYSVSLKGLARNIGAYLEENGAEVTYCGEPASLPAVGGNGPSMAVLTFEDAFVTPWVRDMLESPSGRGLFLSIRGDGLTPLDTGGLPAPVGEEISAAVAASATGIGDPFPVWLVLCDGRKGAEQAGKLLVSDPAGLERRFAVVVGRSGRSYCLPGGER